MDRSGVEGATEMTLLVSVRSSRILPGASENSRRDELIQVGPFPLSHQPKPKIITAKPDGIACVTGAALVSVRLTLRLSCPQTKPQAGLSTEETEKKKEYETFLC